MRSRDVFLAMELDTAYVTLKIRVSDKMAFTRAVWLLNLQRIDDQDFVLNYFRQILRSTWRPK